MEMGSIKVNIYSPGDNIEGFFFPFYFNRLQGKTLFKNVY